ncbi:protein FAM71A [Octodon degus]|uniref:Protein FAM71A n=1 Tax=Octodon degus TaxID=10160 RepID=A0A6P3EMT2_OCTDE|nr:protein FAM71A [Octodon degus]
MVTNSECLLPYYTAQSSSGTGMFSTTMGKLQRHLHKGEYDMFKYAPIFESDFIQITKRGEVIDVHNRVRMVTVGIACTSPILLIPDVMLLARPATNCEEFEGFSQATKGKSRKGPKPLELTRLLPLKFVRISVHDRQKQQLRLKFATGRSCYLQLCPPLDAREDLFTYWEKLIYLLRPPVDSNSSTYATPAEDMLCMPALADEDRTSLAAQDSQGKGDQDQVSIRSLHVVPEVTRATSAAYAGGEGVKPGSHTSNATPKISTSKSRSTEFAQDSARGTKTEAVAGGAVAAAGTAGVAGTASGTLSVAATKSGSGEVNAALAGAASVGEGESKSPRAGTDKTPPKSLSVALAGAVNQFSEPRSDGFSPENSMSAAFAGGEATSNEPGKAPNPAAGGTMASKSPKGAEAGQQRMPPASEATLKERREKKKREDRATSRGSSHRKTHEGRHRTSEDKMARKSSSQSLSSHRTHRASKKETGSHRSARGGRHNRAPKGISRSPIEKESRTSHKSGRSLSTTSSGSTPKRRGKISSFLRNVKANLRTKGMASLRGGDVDVVAKTVEKTKLEAIVETAESGQGVEIVSSVTSEVTEAVIVEAH